MRNLVVLAALLCACSSALVPVRCDSDANCAPGSFCGAGNQCAALPQCTPGTSLCGHACVALASDVANCGSCGNACPASANGAAACSASACTVTCASPYVKTGAACTVAAPGGVAAVGGQRQVTVSWSAVAGATTYSLRRATASGGPYTPVATTGALSAADRDLAPGTRYFYVVRAADASGPGPASAESSAPTVPDAPAGLTATGGGGSIALAWAVAPGADSYRVLRAGADGVFAQLAAPTSTNYSDGPLADGATFAYEVQAVNASGAGPASAPATASTAAALVTPAITAPAFVTAGASAGASIAPRPGMTYAWTIAGGTLSNSSGASVSFVAGASGSVTLSCVETNAANHSSSAGTATVSIAPVPIQPIISTVSQTTPNTVGLTASITKHSGMTYAWSISGGNITTTATDLASITYSAAGAGTLKLSCVETNAAGTSSAAGTATVDVVPATSWAALSPGTPAPSARYSHRAAMDTANNRMIMFSGGDGNVAVTPTLHNDTWVLSNADGVATPSWTQLTPTGTLPQARGYPAIGYDPAQNALVMFGGNLSISNCSQTSNDTWVLSNANGVGGAPVWKQVTPAGGPPSKRNLHTGVYDPVNHRLMVFGGQDACNPDNNETWVLSNPFTSPAWTQLATTGTLPAPRASHIAVYDQADNRMIVSNGDVDNQTWVLSNANGLGGAPVWTQLSPIGTIPPVHPGNEAVYLPSTNELIMTGTTTVSTTQGTTDIWVLSNASGLGAATPAWRKLAASGGPPSQSQDFAIWFQPASNRVGIWSGLTVGTSSYQLTNEMWSLSLPPAGTSGIGGTVTGLSGSGLVLANKINGGTLETLTVSSNGTFVFPTRAPNGGNYVVTVATQPGTPAQACVVTGGTGTANADVTTVQINCAPFVVASGLDSPNALALNGSTLYFAVGLHPGVVDCNTTNPAAGNRVMMVPSAGGTPAMIDYVDNFAGNCGIYGMVFDSSSIYWANYSDGVIKRATLAGASPSVVYNGPTYMNALSIGGSNLYYHSYPNSSLSRVTTAGSGNTTFANTASTNGENLTTDSSSLYWTDYSAGTVNKVPLSASPPASPIILATGETTPAAPFVTSSAIYWLQLGGSGALRYAALASPSAASLNTTPLASPGSFVVDANYAWVLASGTAPNYPDGRIYRIPVGGGTPVIVAQGLNQPSSIAMDAGHLYWCNNSTTQSGGTRNSDGTIMMIVK